MSKRKKEKYVAVLAVCTKQVFIFFFFLLLGTLCVQLSKISVKLTVCKTKNKETGILCVTVLTWHFCLLFHPCSS